MGKTQTTTDEYLVARMETSFAQATEELSDKPNGFDIQLQPLSWFRKNWTDKKVQKLFIENFIKIRSKHEENRIIPFRFNDVQNDLHFKMTGRDAILKSRQQGVSTYIIAMKLAKAILFSGRNIRFVPHDPDAEKEFWSRLDTMYQNLPSDKRPSTRYYSKELIQFQDASKNVTDSRLTSLNPRAGKEDKMRSQTLTDVHLTEIPFWEGDQEKVFTSLMAAAEKGDITLESTAQGKEKFYFYYQLGKQKKGGWTSHFYEWWWLRENRLKDYRFAKFQDSFVLLSPEQSILDIWDSLAETPEEKFENQKRLGEAKVSKKEKKVCKKILAHLKKKKYVSKDENWHCNEVAEYLAWRRSKIIELGQEDLKRGEKLFLVEHPENDVDCFDSSTLTVISPTYLKVTCEAIELSPPKERFDEVRQKIEGHRFLIGCDTSLGIEGGDPAAIEVIDIDTGRQAYSEELLMSPDLLAFRLQEISDWFNFAIIGVERNNTGIATLKKLLELVEPERVFKELTESLKRQVEDNKLTYEEALEEAEFGIATTTANKALYALFLEKAIRNGEIGLSNHDWCKQAQTVVWLNAQKTEWGAMSGHHDDRFIALAIANYLREKNYTNLLGGIEVLPQTGHAR